ncbi:MAG TPA: GyrI-like domain-containing protein [Tepidisphaeraceae bacterium]|jgi:effector-binding domain-containing protein|nr:GyrI-like domain-containing protein [Tepidisphaeraceae bacterium]
MPYKVRIEDVTAPRPIAVVRRQARKAELPRVIPQACGEVWNVVRAEKLKAGRHVAVYLDGVMNLEIGVELDSPFAGSGDVVVSALPTGTIATTTHFGPYPQLHAAHQAIHDWCDASGRTFAGPSWEIYGHWEDSWNTNPSKIRTDVYYLLK